MKRTVEDYIKKWSTIEMALELYKLYKGFENSLTLILILLKGQISKNIL
jgi:hypothetical protein